MNKGVQKIFSQIPDKYELVNHILTLGLDIYWRRKTAKLAVNAGGEIFLDVCTGTGEMAFNLAQIQENKRKVVALDFCIPMLERAQIKDAFIDFVIGDAEKLPFKNEVFDIITISFATRNINVNRETLIRCFKEFRRVLKRGGKFFNLETTQPVGIVAKWLFNIYIKTLVKPVGSIISGSKPAYKYLSYTISKFYNSEELMGILYEAGYSNVFYKKVFPGIVALHIAEK